MHGYMEHVILNFDISKDRSLNLFEICEIREEISLKLDKALRQAGMGKWIGGRGSLGMIKILLQVKGYEPARHLIKSKLEDHWLFQYLKISQY